MTPIAAPTYLTPEAYLELERKAITKNEYVDGGTILADVVPLLSIQCQLSLQHVYRRVKFDNGN